MSTHPGYDVGEATQWKVITIAVRRLYLDPTKCGVTDRIIPENLTEIYMQETERV